MSYNHLMAVLPHASVSMFTPAGPEFDSVYDAISYRAEGPSVTQHGPHVLLVDPTLMSLDERVLGRVDGAVAVAVSGVSDTYIIQRFGSAPRLRVESQGELVENQGAPLVAEAALAGEEFSEDAHFAVFAALTGLWLNDLDTMKWTPIQI